MKCCYMNSTAWSIWFRYFRCRTIFCQVKFALFQTRENSWGFMIDSCLPFAVGRHGKRDAVSQLSLLNKTVGWLFYGVDVYVRKENFLLSSINPCLKSFNTPLALFYSRLLGRNSTFVTLEEKLHHQRISLKVAATAHERVWMFLKYSRTEDVLGQKPKWRYVSQ